MLPMQSPMTVSDQREMGLRGLFRRRLPQAQTGGGLQPMRQPFPNAHTGGGLQPMPMPFPQAQTGGELPPMQQDIHPMTGGGPPPQQGLPGLFVRTGGYDAPRQFHPMTGGGLPPSSYDSSGINPHGMYGGFMDWGRLLGGRMY